jgi:hypothetical protein
MSYCEKLGVTTNDVCGAVAKAMLKDLIINTFALNGFPAVKLEEKDDEFHITLISEGLTSKSLFMSEEKGLSYAKLFRNGEPVPRELLRKVQDILADLEGRTRR